MAYCRYGPDVENYLEVYLRTPDLPRTDVAKALLARGNARKRSGDRLLAKAQEGAFGLRPLFLASNDDFSTRFPSGSEVGSIQSRNTTTRQARQAGGYIHVHISNMRSNVATQIHFMHEPASQRAPSEVWERIALFIPRYHLRTWLFVSSFHREIAARQIFHTLDLYFGEDQENLNRGLDIFDRAKADPLFASRVKRLRLHWAYEEGDMLDLTARERLQLLSSYQYC